MNRKKFIFSGLSTLFLSSLLKENLVMANSSSLKKIRIGIVGLDSTHALAFTKAISEGTFAAIANEFGVVAAYPYGSKTIPLSVQRIPKFVAEMESLGVKICKSIEDVLKQVDVVLLETNDGNLHLEQARTIIKAGKPLFIDKPIANSYEDAVEIFRLSKEYNCPIFSTSSLRYLDGIPTLQVEQVKSADVYSPAYIEPSHKDLYWYGIHGVEMLIAIMGTTCISVRTIEGKDSTLYIGSWQDGRIASLRGIRSGKDDFGGTVFLENEIVSLGKFQGYNKLLFEILTFFKKKKSPISALQTLAVCAFIDAAQTSKEQGGKEVFLQNIDTALV